MITDQSDPSDRKIVVESDAVKCTALQRGGVSVTQRVLEGYAWRDRVVDGTPPLRLADGLLVLHHGVAGYLRRAGRPFSRRSARGWSSAARPDDVTRVQAKAASLLREPELAAEHEGVVAKVVFPTAIDFRGDGVADIMADTGSAPSASRCPWLLPGMNH